MYRWSKHIDFYRSIGWVVKHRYYNIEALPHRLYSGVMEDVLVAFLVWDATEQKWEVQIGRGVEAQRFITDEGTYRNPPRKLVELLVAARGDL